MESRLGAAGDLEALEIQPRLQVGAEAVGGAQRRLQEPGVLRAAEQVELEVRLARLEDLGRRHVEDGLLRRDGSGRADDQQREQEGGAPRSPSASGSVRP